MPEPSPDVAREMERLSDRAFLNAEASDLRARIDLARRRERRHQIRGLLGISPSAVIIGLGLFARGQLFLIVLLSVLVTISELWRARQSGNEAEELAQTLERLEEMNLG